MISDQSQLSGQLNRYIINDADRNFIYGTAGFRTEGQRLFGIAYRIGILSALRSMQEGGAVIGVMVTASHNKAGDNGLKVIDKGGEMLEESWEQIAVEFTRVSVEAVPDFIKIICKKRRIDIAIRGTVFLGEDNRITSPLISSIVADGVNIMSGKYTNFGRVTTPQLHFLVYKQNSLKLTDEISDIDCYFRQICGSFLRLRSNKVQSLISPLFVDCANGVGAEHLARIKWILQPLLSNLFICNCEPSGRVINFSCGADYVKSKLKFPKIHNGDVSEICEGQRWASIDGDADRLIYFFKENENLFVLDGDRQAIIIAEYIKEQLETVANWSTSEVKLGIVQTAYANSSCTRILVEKIGVPVTCVPTGVKYLHHMGKEFDIRIYFEANGHGSIILSEKGHHFLETNLSGDHPLRLLLLNGVINEAVGDAFSILLLLEHIMSEKNLSLQSWHDLYYDLPSSLLQVRIKDRRVISTTDSERTVLTPVNLQRDINNKIKEFGTLNDSRAFVRPSGTEDLVRVYAESESQESATNIALEVARLVFDQVGGVGVRP